MQDREENKHQCIPASDMLLCDLHGRWDCPLARETGLLLLAWMYKILSHLKNPHHRSQCPTLFNQGPDLGVEEPLRPCTQLRQHYGLLLGLAVQHNPPYHLWAEHLRQSCQGSLH